jgi:hypothetical protein
MLWNLFRPSRAHAAHDVMQSSLSASVQLPFPGLGLSELRQIWADKQRFVPVEEAFAVLIERQLRADCGLRDDDPRFQIVSHLVRSLAPPDRLTGYTKSDFLDLNLALARMYLGQHYDHPATTCAVRTESNAFVLYSVRPDGIVVLKLRGKNFAGLNRALSTTAEMDDEAQRRQQSEEKASRRIVFDGPERRQQPRNAAPDYSQMGYARGDTWIQTLAARIYTMMRRDRGPLTPAGFHSRVCGPFLAWQAKLMEESGLDCIQVADAPETGVGLTGALRILSPDTGWNLPDDADMEAGITAAHRALGYPVASLPPGKTPVTRLYDPAHAMVILDQLTDREELDWLEERFSAYDPTRLPPQYRSVLQMEPHTLIEKLLVANAEAVQRLWDARWDRYKAIVNQVLRMTHSDRGHLHQLIRDVCTASTRADPDCGFVDVIALVDVMQFPALQQRFGAVGAEAVRAEIIARFRAALVPLATVHDPRNEELEVFRQTGRRTPDAAKFAVILRGVTESRALVCVAEALRTLAGDFLSRFGFDRDAGVGVCAAVAPIPPGYVSFDSAFRLIGSIHQRLDALRAANLAKPDAMHLVASRDAFHAPLTLDTSAHPVGDLAQTAAALIEKYHDTARESRIVDYFEVAAPLPAPMRPALAGNRAAFALEPAS